jgi:mxaL protein
VNAPLRRLFAGSAQWRLAAALVLLVASVLMPDITLPRRTFDYMVSFDITQSMNVEDVELDGQPVRRIALARAAMRDVLRHLPCGSKVGWSVFSAYRSFVLLLPIEVCANYDVLLSSLDKIADPMRWSNASNVSKGLYWTMRNAKDLQPVRVVFITDGQEAPSTSIDQILAPPTEPGEVEGLLIGVGGGAPSRIPKTNTEGTVTGYWTRDEIQQASGDAPGDGHEELSERRDDYLLEVARRNGLVYEPIESPDALTSLLTERRWSLQSPGPTSVRWVAALLGFLVLVWHYLGPARKRRAPAVTARVAAPVRKAAELAQA